MTTLAWDEKKRRYVVEHESGRKGLSRLLFADFGLAVAWLAELTGTQIVAKQ